MIALIFHATGSTGPGAATTNMSVFVLSILIAQVTMPHRHLRQLLSAPSHTTRYVANPQLATTWQRRRDDPQRVRVLRIHGLAAVQHRDELVDAPLAGRGQPGVSDPEEDRVALLPLTLSNGGCAPPHELIVTHTPHRDPHMLCESKPHPRGAWIWVFSTT